MDYAGNSDKSKEESKPDIKDKQIEKVVTGEVIQKQRSIGRKFKDIFFGGDVKSASRYVAADVLLPALRNLVVDMTTKGVERIMFGESMRYRNRPYEYRPRVQYNNPTLNPINPLYRRDPRERVHLPDQPPRRPGRRDADDIILASRGEAELVLERLTDIIDKYEVASKADLLDLLGLQSSYVDNKWGWTYLSNVEIRQIREGYLIDLPPMEEI